MRNALHPTLNALTRQTPPRRWLLAALPQALACAGLLALVPAAQAQIFGSLGNFDVVNNTGHAALGFEIEIEDPAYDHPGMITSVFGLDRVFPFVSNDPGAVVRFGKPNVSHIASFGAIITYGGPGGAVTTPSAAFTTYGESCWPGANLNWKSTSCDHFGVSTYGSPLKTNYRWLLDNGTKQTVAVPAVNIIYTPPQPPVPNQPPPQPPAPPVINLKAQDVNVDPADPVANNLGNAFWVRVTTTELPENVELGDLLVGNQQGARPEIAALQKPETQSEWHELQLGHVDEVSKELKGVSPAEVVRFQFFKYVGPYDGEGIIDPGSLVPQMDANGVAYVDYEGQRTNLEYVGQQIAGFNAVQGAAPAVPEPAEWLLMAAGLGIVAQRVRGRASR